MNQILENKEKPNFGSSFGSSFGQFGPSLGP